MLLRILCRLAVKEMMEGCWSYDNPVKKPLALVWIESRVLCIAGTEYGWAPDATCSRRVSLDPTQMNHAQHPKTDLGWCRTESYCTHKLPGRGWNKGWEKGKCNRYFSGWASLWPSRSYLTTTGLYHLKIKVNLGCVQPWLFRKRGRWE